MHGTVNVNINLGSRMPHHTLMVIQITPLTVAIAVRRVSDEFGTCRDRFNHFWQANTA
jgi:hypothetical protein